VCEDIFAPIVGREVTKSLGLIPRLDFSSDGGHCVFFVIVLRDLGRRMKSRDCLNG
jgi:hypothetical protein